MPLCRRRTLALGLACAALAFAGCGGSDKENEADRPKKWGDVVDPKYKGKLVHADPSFTAIANALVSTFTGVVASVLISLVAHMLAPAAE